MLHLVNDDVWFVLVDRHAVYSGNSDTIRKPMAARMLLQGKGQGEVRDW